jgi:lipid A 3-O-deacylase
VFSHLKGTGHWYSGNWELLGDLFGGFQYHPDRAYLAGVTPILRYEFATGTRFVPFIDLGAGATLTDIRDGDLSTKFEFNLQYGFGTHYFLRDDLALTAQYRFIHLSNAGISSPNLGVNNNTVYLGLSWFF